MSGATAGPGTCTVAGVQAYFGMKNAEGGVEFGDGQTRTVEIEALDDTYDPQQAAANYDQLKDDVFAMTAGLGTPTNRAWRDAAIADEVPQVLIMTGDPLFSDTEQSPWQLGFVPIYQNEGEAFGELLAASGEEHKVAILSQNDDYGEGYVEGFKSAVEGADNIEIVEELTYEATDTSVDAQITELANSGADVFFNAMSVTPLVISALQKAQQLNWLPSWFLPSNTSSPGRSSSPAARLPSRASTPCRSPRRRRAPPSPRTRTCRRTCPPSPSTATTRTRRRSRTASGAGCSARRSSRPSWRWRSRPGTASWRRCARSRTSRRRSCWRARR
ncbi:ABC transporter substrate-binding protein [Blastococcus brunescens]|uniref:ABC transporter substrate-binding protein n=1 Tax=Blastococcus brunescens TaxID=1564165 RepID=A0ABZ1BB92_9ACTN|nr:ABC transporter substrate-binding protein [Blastococcus sp. BMG 8361]WRL66904.1 ABC transporter substrate-binding protein [Blastococcus sp. BMG 8361]